MARGWRIIDASNFEGTLAGRRGRITLHESTISLSEFPAEDLAVVLIGPNTSVTSAALHYAAKHDVVILAVDWRGVPYSGVFNWSAHTRVGARHIAQASLSLPRKKNAWMQLVKAKIRGQAETLRPIDRDAAARLDSIARNVRTGDPNNAEGIAARIYWQRVFRETAEFSRDQFGLDNLNVMLNYGYTILRGFAIRAVLGAGLAPPLGLFHRGRSNYFNLVDDLIEPFRPAIDDFVVRLIDGTSLNSPGVKQGLARAASQPFLPDGTRIPGALDDLAQLSIWSRERH